MLVSGLGGQGAGLVVVQPQGGFQRRDQLGPFLAVGNAPVQISSQRPASWRPRVPVNTPHRSTSIPA